ncbi:MAG: carbohydrate-binding protein [Sulfuricaulis sp.]
MLLVVAGCGGGASEETASGPAVPLGVNLEIVSDWGRSIMFADAMKHARHWGSINVPHDEQASVDPDGWPTGDAGVVIMTDMPHMAGVYKLSFTGRAAVEPVARNDLTTCVQNMVYNASTNTSTADIVLGPNETQLFLVFTGTSGGVKNVKLMRPGHLPTDIFSKPFLDRLAMFQVLRFIDYSNTIGNPQVNWSDRTLPTRATQAGPAGAAWEHAIELANLTGKDPWINIPDQATDHYVRQLALLFKNNLAPDRKLYVEWSNEVWNDIFIQAQRNYGATNAEIATGWSNLNYDGETNLVHLAWRRTARRAKEVSDIFRSVFGDAAMMTRVRPVLAGQLARPAVITQGLEFIANVFGPPARYFYAVAPAVYFDIDNSTRTDLTVDQIFTELPAQVTALKNNVLLYTVWAQHYKLKNMAYEGGPHLTGNESLNAKLAANRDPRMQNLIIQLYNDWFSSGGDLFLHYSLASKWGQYGSWGLNDDITQPTGPKWGAISHMHASPRPQTGVGKVLPATLFPPDVNVSRNAFAAGNQQGLNDETSFVMYLVNAPSTGTYSFATRMSSNGGATAKLLIDSDVVTENWNVSAGKTASVTASFPLSAGLHVLRIQPKSGSFQMGPLVISQ